LFISVLSRVGAIFTTTFSVRLDVALQLFVCVAQTELRADPNIKPARSPSLRLSASGDEGREAKMIVSTILATKGRDVVTIDPSANLSDAAQLLTERRIGAALVLGADHRVVGIISERDIVRALAERGAAALVEPVSQTMTRKVETCNESEPISNIMERMTAGKFRHVPVVAQGRLIGIVSIGDVVKHRVQQIESESAAMREYILSA
jgi:CBS domain-containing protein